MKLADSLLGLAGGSLEAPIGIRGCPQLKSPSCGAIGLIVAMAMGIEREHFEEMGGRGHGLGNLGIVGVRNAFIMAKKFPSTTVFLVPVLLSIHLSPIVRG